MLDNIFNQNLRVTYYARVSTQFESQISSLENQKSHYENMINNNPNWTLFSGYIDEGISGTSALKRENFLNMISDAKKGLFDLIITKEISRFSRNTLESISYTRELLKCGVGVYFESDSICTLATDSELRLTIMSAIYQDEIRRISERIKFGFKEAIDNSKVLGTGNLIGYTKKDGKLFIEKESAVLVKKIFNLYADKKIGIRQISKELEKEGYLNSNGNPYTFSTIKNIITNPKYKGFYCGSKYENIDFRYGKKTKKDADKWVIKRDENIPKIVDEQLWDRANKILKERSQNKTVTNTKYDFSSKIFCDTDKSSFHRIIINGNEAWQCAKKQSKKCDNITVYTDETCFVIDKIFNSEVDFNIISDKLIKIYSSFKEENKNPNDDKIKNLIKVKASLNSLLVNEVITKDEYLEKIRQTDNKINELNKPLQFKTAYTDNVKNGIKNIFNTRKSQLISTVINKIYVKGCGGFNIQLTIYLTNGKIYTASYSKKGRKVLSTPIVEMVK